MSDDIENIPLNEALMKQAGQTKCKLDSHTKLWDIAKKNINEYEYVYTSSNYNKNVSGFMPVSRSFFKMREILYDYNINVKGTIACIAEAPGGFIQCLLKGGYHNDITGIHGITLSSDDPDVPFWHNVISRERLVTTYTGEDGTGDIYKLHNIIDYIRRVGKSSCSIITCDGGFDYSSNFNDQELSSYSLIYNEIFMGLNIQQKNGTFICKVFDMFYYSTLQLLYVLYISYNSVSFCKPYTSRPSNSEKYVVCRGFRGYNKDISNMMCSYINRSILPIQVPKEFMDSINQYNEGYIGQQVSFINHGIGYIIKKRVKYTKPTPRQIMKAKEWCNRYNISINKDCTYIK